jgi:hypothetical protein
MSKQYPPPDRRTNIHGRILAIQNTAIQQAQARALDSESSSTFGQLLHIEMEKQAKTLRDLRNRLKNCPPLETSPKATPNPKPKPQAHNVASSILHGSGEALDRAEALTQGIQQAHQQAKRAPSLKTLLDSLANAIDT